MKKTTEKLPTFKQSRNWCFTDFKLLSFKKIYKHNKGVIRYICWGKEICPKTKRIHYQGWIQFINKKKMGGVKRILNSKQIHLECCRGNEQQNDKYCQKDNEYAKFGKPISQGFRTDLEDIKHRLDNQEPMKNIADDYFSNYIRYHRGFTKYAELVAKKKSQKFRKVYTTLLRGETGTGKTRSAIEFNTDYYKITGSQLEWFDGYEGESTLIIDEYANDVKITTLLNLLDGYQLRLPIKGGFTYANWTTVFITTNLENLHSQALECHRKALKRRIGKTIVFAEVTKR